MLVRILKKDFDFIKYVIIFININHYLKGHPFMENLKENRLLLYSILVPSMLVVMLSMGFSSDLTNTFEIVDFPVEVSDLIQL